jgi:hypothetical protein
MDDLERFSEEGGRGPELIRLVEKLRTDRPLRRRLEEEILLLSGASSGESYLVIDRRLLDDFYNGAVPMPQRLQILSALCIDDGLWDHFRQIDEMYRAAKEYKEEEADSDIPDELRETVASYDGAHGRIPLAAMSVAYYRWRIEERHPGCRYEIKPQAARRVLGAEGSVGLVDEALVSAGPIRCAIAFSPHERRLELQIANCPLNRERFAQAEILLRGPTGFINPSLRRHSDEFCLAVFEDVDPLASYVLEIDPDLLKG